MNTLNINRLISGGLITNYNCTSTCRHCLYRCSPKWDNDYIEPNTVESNLQKVKALGCNSLHIGGGEPMLKPDMLINVLDTATRIGVSIEYVETNSSWFHNHKSALDLLRTLQDHGLHTLLVSISPFHVEHIPFAKVKGVIRACQQTGMNIFPWISDFYNELDELPDHTKHSMQEYIKLFGDQWPQSVLDRYWLSTGGRTLDLLRTFSSRRIPLERLRHNGQRCSELKETGHFHVDLYGYYIPGLCTGLGIKTDDLGTELDKEIYPLVTLLYNNGISGLLEYAESEYGFKAKHDSYVAKCELCVEIRTFLVNEKNIQSQELHPLGHYAEIKRN